MKQARLVVAIALALGACSNASEFTPSIKQFAAATEKAETSFAEIDQAAAARATERRRQIALADPTKVKRDGCLHGTGKCDLLVADKDGLDVPLQVTTFVREQRRAFEAISAYAKALEAVATADATKEVKAAVDQAAVAIAALATAVGAAPAAPFAMPIGRLVTWAYGQYQEYIKLDALRHATREMQPVMQQAAGIFGTTAEAAVEHAQVSTRAAFNASFDSFRDPNIKGDKTAALDQMMARRSSLHAAMTMQPDKVFTAMAAAHASLTEALRQDDITVADAVKKLQSFAAEAEKLFAIAEDLHKAGASN